MNEEERKYYFMRTHLGMSPDEIAEIEKLVDKWNSIPEEYLIPVVDWAKLDCLTMSEEQFTKIYCNNCGSQRCEGINSEWFDGCKFKEHLSR